MQIYLKLERGGGGGGGANLKRKVVVTSIFLWRAALLRPMTTSLQEYPPLPPCRSRRQRRVMEIYQDFKETVTSRKTSVNLDLNIYDFFFFKAFLKWFVSIYNIIYFSNVSLEWQILPHYYLSGFSFQLLRYFQLVLWAVERLRHYGHSMLSATDVCERWRNAADVSDRGSEAAAEEWDSKEQSGVSSLLFRTTVFLRGQKASTFSLFVQP